MSRAITVSGIGHEGDSAHQSAERELARQHAERHHAEAYAEFFGPVTRRFLRQATNTLPSSARLVADVGAGGAELARLLAGSGRRCVAFDHSPAMLTGCRDSGIPAVVCDAEALPCADGSFDAVVAAFLLPHLADPVRVLAEMKRVLRPAGTVIVLGWANGEESPFTGLASTLLAERADPTVRQPLTEAARRTAVPWLIELARAQGFQQLQVETLSTTVSLPSAGAWWRGMIGASTGLSLLLQATEPELRRTVQEEFLVMAEAYRRGSQLVVPVAAHLLRAIR
jgi:ubiquinone/menaquinone biosynthesis C-methylase UbiE